LREKLYSKFHPKLAKTYDSLAEVHSMKRNWAESAVHLKASIQILARVFGEESIELGHEYAKIAQIYYNADNYVESMENVELARGILNKHYSAEKYQVLRELEELRKHLLEFFEQTVGPYWST
jgi:hypothetical protein